MQSFFKLFRTPSRLACKPRLRLDCFEERLVPAQVTASVANGVLMLVAQDVASSEGLTIVNGNVPGEVQVTGAAPVAATPTTPATPGTTLKFGKLVGLTDRIFSGIKSVNLVLKGGADNVSVKGLKILGNLSVDGGDGGNKIDISDSSINGSLTIKNGNGGKSDVKIGDSTSQVIIGKSLFVNQGSRADESSLSISGARVYGAAKITGGSGKDSVAIDNSDFRSSFSVLAAKGDDAFIADAVKVSGAVKIALGEGANTATLQGSDVGRAFSITGGTGVDSVKLFGNKLLGNAAFNLGRGDDSAKFDKTYFAGNMSCDLGNGVNQLGINADASFLAGDSFEGTTVAGNLSITGGNGVDTVNIGGTGYRLVVSGSTTMSLGSELSGGDIVTIDDIRFAGVTKIDLGAFLGNDSLSVEQLTTASNVLSYFDGKVQVLCGGGDDKVGLGVLATSGTQLRFVSSPVIDGGTNKNKLPKENDIIDPADLQIAGNFPSSSVVFYKNFETKL